AGCERTSVVNAAPVRDAMKAPAPQATADHVRPGPTKAIQTYARYRQITAPLFAKLLLDANVHTWHVDEVCLSPDPDRDRARATVELQQITLRLCVAIAPFAC